MVGLQQRVDETEAALQPPWRGGRKPDLEGREKLAWQRLSEQVFQTWELGWWG